jgi:1,4-dihydroxy-2-naphthoate octaprenyltransferase
MPVEPSRAALPNPLVRYFLATRPAFLSVTATACLVGLATAAADGVDLDAPAALVTVLFALVAHAGVNVLNDYYDAVADAGNSERLYPFTGGSRFIQNGVLSERQTGLFGLALLAAVVSAGLALAAHAGAGLIGIGAAGLLVGWAYSAPPLALASRGLGEAAVSAGWLLVVLGTDYVQRGAVAPTPLAAGLSQALLVAAVLFINQFPDRRADGAAGKRTLVVRLGPSAARWGYPVIAGGAYGWLGLQLLLGQLPAAAALAMAPLPLNAWAAGRLLRHAARPARLAGAIRATIAAAVAHGLLLAGALAGA